MKVKSFGSSAEKFEKAVEEFFENNPEVERGLKFMSTNLFPSGQGIFVACFYEPSKPLLLEVEEDSEKKA